MIEAVSAEDAIAWCKCGYSLANLGRYEATIESFDQVIALQPDLG